MFSKKIRNGLSVILAASLALSLTACDPPMPPDVEAQILEQTYTCVDGNTTVSLPESMTDLGFQWADSLTFSCVDPEPAMTLEMLGESVAADISVSAYALDTALCTPLATVPFALDAGEFAYQLSEAGSLNLSPKTIAAIFKGEITNWNDPKIADENPGSVFSDLPIIVRKDADEQALKSVTSWFSRLDAALPDSVFSPTQNVNLSTFVPLEEGEIALVQHSLSMQLGLMSAAIYLGADKETQEPILAISDTFGIASAATQLVAKKQGTTGVTMELDPKIEPVAQAGMEDAGIPYQAIYPVNLTICGEDSLLHRAGALFLLRLDSQGALAASVYNPLSEQIRVESLAMVRKGLPLPELPAE